MRETERQRQRKRRRKTGMSGEAQKERAEGGCKIELKEDGSRGGEKGCGRERESGKVEKQ